MRFNMRLDYFPRETLVAVSGLATDNIGCFEKAAAE